MHSFGIVSTFILHQAHLLLQIETKSLLLVLYHYRVNPLQIHFAGIKDVHKKY